MINVRGQALQFGSLIVSVCILSTGCEVREQVVSSNVLYVSNDGVEIVCEPPLYRRKAIAYLECMLEKPWTPTEMFDAIIFEEKNLTGTFAATLISTAGETYRSQSIGGSHGEITLRFNPQIPRDVKIRKIILRASVPLECTNVTWYDLSPL